MKLRQYSCSMLLNVILLSSSISSVLGTFSLYFMYTSVQLHSDFCFFVSMLKSFPVFLHAEMLSVHCTGGLSIQQF